MKIYENLCVLICSSLFPLASSLFPLPSSLFPLASSLFPLPSSLFHLPSSIFHLSSSIFNLPSSIFHLPGPAECSERLNNLFKKALKTNGFLTFSVLTPSKPPNITQSRFHMTKMLPKWLQSDCKDSPNWLPSGPKATRSHSLDHFFGIRRGLRIILGSLRNYFMYIKVHFKKTSVFNGFLSFYEIREPSWAHFRFTLKSHWAYFGYMNITLGQFGVTLILLGRLWGSFWV